MTSEAELKAFATTEYWNKRYKSEDENAKTHVYEWCGDFKTLKPFFTKYLPAASKNPAILHLGCGNSNLPKDLHDLGYKTQTAIDFSGTVISAMKAKYADIDAKWEVMDVTDMTYGAETFDVAIDKGTLDAFVHGDPFKFPEDTLANAALYMNHVHNILKPGGVFLYITWQYPPRREGLLDPEGKLWDMKKEHIGEDGALGYNAFVMTKKK